MREASLHEDARTWIGESRRNDGSGGASPAAAAAAGASAPAASAAGAEESTARRPCTASAEAVVTVRAANRARSRSRRMPCLQRRRLACPQWRGVLNGTTIRTTTAVVSIPCW